jgi:cytochrome P450
LNKRRKPSNTGAPGDVPIEEINVAQPALFETDEVLPLFERLRTEDPVHLCEKSDFGPYWSITKYNDIKWVAKNHELFSSVGGPAIDDNDEDFDLPMFIAMDPPEHTRHRQTVSPIVSPKSLAAMQDTIRTRVQDILDDLPNDEDFDWVEHVSVELTVQMLATLMDFPFEDRWMLSHWSDVATSMEQDTDSETYEQDYRAELMECLAYFSKLWNERVNEEPRNDLISMLAHGPATRNMTPMEFLGTVILLIVAGNDTVRNTISGGVLALNENPEQYEKLRKDPALIRTMVGEIIRWQTPLAHMRRRATQDVTLGGKTIREGDKVVLWYLSGNRDDEVIERPNAFLIDRTDSTKHLSFGAGIHRCMGKGLAELQLKIVWEEILKRFHTVEVVGEPERVRSVFVRGFSSLPVRLHRTP